jgi:hypothetical protein
VLPGAGKKCCHCADISACDSIRDTIARRGWHAAVRIAISQSVRALKSVRLRAPHLERYELPKLARSLCAGTAGEGSCPDTRHLRSRTPRHPGASDSASDFQPYPRRGDRRTGNGPPPRLGNRREEPEALRHSSGALIETHPRLAPQTGANLGHPAGLAQTATRYYRWCFSKF